MNKMLFIFIALYLFGCEAASSTDEGKLSQVKNNSHDFDRLERLMEAHKNDLAFRVELNDSGDLYLTNRKTGELLPFDALDKKEFVEVMKKLRIWSITTHKDFYTIISIGPKKRKKVEHTEYWVNISNYFLANPSGQCTGEIFNSLIGGCEKKIEGNWYLSYSWFKKN